MSVWPMSEEFYKRVVVGSISKAITSEIQHMVGSEKSEDAEAARKVVFGLSCLLGDMSDCIKKELEDAYGDEVDKSLLDKIDEVHNKSIKIDLRDI